VFGILLEHYIQGPSAKNWLLGEDFWTPSIPGDAMRYASSPHSAANNDYTADDDPDHYSERYLGASSRPFG
jgi:Zn-dependent metalloprotease